MLLGKKVFIDLWMGCKTGSIDTVLNFLGFVFVYLMGVNFPSERKRF